MLDLCNVLTSSSNLYELRSNISGGEQLFVQSRNIDCNCRSVSRLDCLPQRFILFLLIKRKFTEEHLEDLNRSHTDR